MAMKSSAIFVSLPPYTRIPLTLLYLPVGDWIIVDQADGWRDGGAVDISEGSSRKPLSKKLLSPTSPA